jgi:hypothetical protein
MTKKPEHIDNCICQFTHEDCVTAEGRRNLATYEIDSRCHHNGITAGEGTTHHVVRMGDKQDTSIPRDVSQTAEGVWLVRGWDERQTAVYYYASRDFWRCDGCRETYGTGCRHIEAVRAYQD